MKTVNETVAVEYKAYISQTCDGGAVNSSLCDLRERLSFWASCVGIKCYFWPARDSFNQFQIGSRVSNSILCCYGTGPCAYVCTRVFERGYDRDKEGFNHTSHTKPERQNGRPFATISIVFAN